MASPTFHELEIDRVRRVADDACAIRFAVPASLRDTFRFLPGQYVTLRATIHGKDVRRSYSICTPPALNGQAAPGKTFFEVGIRHIEDGVFSGFAADLKAGDTVQVMSPQGRFTALDGTQHNYLLIAAGSGITPILSIAEATLRNEPDSTLTLIYGNRRVASTMFRDELNALKDEFTSRIQLVHILSREAQDVALFNGHIDTAKLSHLSDTGLLDTESYDAAYLCGPLNMVSEISTYLAGAGMDEKQIRQELFATDNAGFVANNANQVSGKRNRSGKSSLKGTPVRIIIDGVQRDITVNSNTQTVLSAATAQGLDLPFSCAGGMCATCRCKVLDGEAAMDTNYSLQQWEIEAGFTLACQTRPLTENLTLDFDAT